MNYSYEESYKESLENIFTGTSSSSPETFPINGNGLQLNVNRLESWRKENKISFVIPSYKELPLEMVQSPFRTINLHNQANELPQESLQVSTKKIDNFEEIYNTIFHESQFVIGCSEHKFLFVDIDGTVLRYNELIDKNTPKVLRKFADSGFYVIFATARDSDPTSRKSTNKELEKAGINTTELEQIYEKFGKKPFQNICNNETFEDNDPYKGVTQFESSVLYTTTQGIKGLEILKLIHLNGIPLKNCSLYFIDDNKKETSNAEEKWKQYGVTHQIFQFVVNLTNQY